MDALEQLGCTLLDRGLLPDFVLRTAVKLLSKKRLREIDQGSTEKNHDAKMDWIQRAKQRQEIGDGVQEANEQHYEVPTDFILSAIGPRAKYSCCLYPTGRESIEEAEVCALEDYCKKGRLQANVAYEILDLGCGWGSLSLFLAERYPKASITALSNSATQKKYIDSHGFKNLRVITGDVNTFDFNPSTRFDRVFSIELFEHMKNYQALLQKISTWLKPNAKAKGGEALLFVHIFCHKDMPYDFISSDGWMAKTFFTGGTMPSFDLFTYFQRDLVLEKSWWVNGQNYGRTSEDWVRLQDSHRGEGLATLRNDAVARGLPKEDGDKQWYRFRTFFITVAVFFALDKGETWGVGHYLFKNRV